MKQKPTNVALAMWFPVFLCHLVHLVNPVSLVTV